MAGNKRALLRLHGMPPAYSFALINNPGIAGKQKTKNPAMPTNPNLYA
jgi:hypothetical protein